jgi:hypothetical protein
MTNQNDNQLKNSFYSGGFWTLFIIYAAYQIIIFSNWITIVPDERMFIGGAQNFSFFSRTAPPYQYGSFFWILLSILKSQLLIRIFFLVLFLTIPLLITSLYKKPLPKLICLLFYLSTPYAFWTGKLISPEILVLFLGSLGLYFYPKKIYLSAFLVGLAVGVKLTGLPFVIFLLTLALLNKISFRVILHSSILCLIGFWLANPINADLYVSEIIQSKLNSNIALSFDKQRLQEMLFEEKWAWDNVLTNSFSQMICSPYILIGLIFVISVNSLSLATAVSAFALGSFYMVYSGQDLYAWYFFPFIPVIMFALRSLEMSSVTAPHNSALSYKKIWLASALALILIAINFYQTIPYSIFQANEKFQHIANRKNYPTECVGKAIWAYNPTTLINKSEFEAKLPPIPRETILLGAFGSDIGAPGERSMVLIGARFIANPYHLQTMLKPGQPLIKYAICDNIYIFVSK